MLPFSSDLFILMTLYTGSMEDESNFLRAIEDLKSHIDRKFSAIEESISGLRKDVSGLEESIKSLQYNNTDKDLALFQNQ